MKRRNILLYSLLLIASCIVVTIHLSDRSGFNDSGSSLKKLRFTVTDIQDFQQLQRNYGALQTVLEEVLNKRIELVPFDSYVAAAAALQSAQLDFALTGPSEYVVMQARTNAVPIIAITRPNYRSLICVSATSKIKSVAQLKGKKIAMWKVGSTSGHIGAMKLLIDAGLNPETDLKILMLASQGLPALQKGEIDAWGGSSARYEEFLTDKGLSEQKLPPIVRSTHLPNDLFVASSQLDSDFVQQMRDRLIKHQGKLIQSLSTVEEGKYKASKLVPAKDSDYNMIREVYKAIGQDRFLQ